MTDPTRHEPIQISEAELDAMTADLQDLHEASVPVMHDAIAEWTEERAAVGGRGLRSITASRRGFLAGAGLAIGGIALAACGSSSSKSSSSTTKAKTVPANTSGSGLEGDLAVVALAAGLENLAVATYGAGIQAATAGKLGAVPPAVVNFATTAKTQHQAHADAWNAVLASAGKSKVTGVDTTVKTAVVDPAFANVKDVPGLAKLALTLEDVAAATYLEGLGVVTSPGGIKTAASIQPVEMQHSAILNFVLGQYPVPASFATTDGARPLTDNVA